MMSSTTSVGTTNLSCTSRAGMRINLKPNEAAPQLMLTADSQRVELVVVLNDASVLQGIQQGLEQVVQITPTGIRWEHIDLHGQAAHLHPYSLRQDLFCRSFAVCASLRTDQVAAGEVATGGCRQ